MTKKDSFETKDVGGTPNGDVKAIDGEAQGILGSTALKLRGAAARLVSARFVEPVKERIPSEQEVFDGIKKAPGIALKAIDALWASPPHEPGDLGKPPASKPARQASAPPPGIESIWGLPGGGAEVMGAPGDLGKPPASKPARQASAPPPGIESIWGLPGGGAEVMGAPGNRGKQKKNRDEDVTLNDILPVPPGW